MKIFSNEDTQESALIKCLECRLVGKPPKFNLAAPPPLPADILEQLNADDFNTIQQLKHKKCLKSNKFLNVLQQQHKQTTVNDMLIQSSSLVTTAPFILTSTQSFYIFIICLIVFFLVLFVAFLFLIKLYRIKKQLEERSNSKSTSDLIKSNRQHIFNCLSSSLSSSSASSTTSSNTINSNLILTPMNQEQNKTDLAYNQLFTFNPNSSCYLQQKLQNLDEYAEISSQTYKYDKNVVYNQYDSRLQSNSSSSIETSSTACNLAPLIQNSRQLLASQNGLIFFNPTIINQDTMKSNLYYVC